MDRDPAPAPAPPPASSQGLARIALATAIVGVGLWILRDFLAALVWAGVLAIAFWPIYRRLQIPVSRPIERIVAPALATTVIGIIFIAPLVLLGIALARESHFVVEFIRDARHDGIAAPDWLGQLPIVGASIAEWWRTNLADPVAAEELIGRVNLRTLTESAREYGGEVVHRLALLLFTLLTLFFVFRDGDRLAEQLRRLGDQLIGLRGERIAGHMIAAVHGTVNGLVLVGLAEGFLLGIVYFAANLPHAAIVGAITAVAAVIPFAAPVVYTLAGLYLFTVGNTVGAIVILVSGSVIVFIADHFVRPVLIGGAARLPFLWVLLGILGGLQTFGFLGLFLGPALMAALVALWREWTEASDDRTDIPRQIDTAAK
ncbi:MAG TPA: AI-2E family transporter [Stellaceae bacterium]|jgi:predicted PurR-regulated permease PerM